MKVTLIEFTGKGAPNETWRAADVMIFTKHTRINMHPAFIDEVAGWTQEEKLRELKYMANTIPSSWEFCEYTLFVEGVTRALTHQLVRNRHSSFAQQTMQILDVRDFSYETGPTVKEGGPMIQTVYDRTMRVIRDSYAYLLDHKVKVEDARNLLPHGIHTNIVWKCNLRTLCEELRKREGPRNLGEIADLTNAVKAEVVKVHPWASLFFDRTADQACRELDDMIKHVNPHETRIKMHKLVDQLRMKG